MVRFNDGEGRLREQCRPLACRVKPFASSLIAKLFCVGKKKTVSDQYIYTEEEKRMIKKSRNNPPAPKKTDYSIADQNESRFVTVGGCFCLSSKYEFPGRRCR